MLKQKAKHFCISISWENVQYSLILETFLRCQHTKNSKIILVPEIEHLPNWDSQRMPSFIEYLVIASRYIAQQNPL